MRPNNTSGTLSPIGVSPRSYRVQIGGSFEEQSRSQPLNLVYTNGGRHPGSKNSSVDQCEKWEVLSVNPHRGNEFGLEKATPIPVASSRAPLFPWMRGGVRVVAVHGPTSVPEDVLEDLSARMH